MRPKKLGLRWTVGKVSPLGFEALRLSVWSAWNLFGEFAEYAICVNTIDISSAKSKTGQLPIGVNWCDATNSVPEWLAAHVDKKMAEGVAWKFAPVRLFRDAYEISATFAGDIAEQPGGPAVRLFAMMKGLLAERFGEIRALELLTAVLGLVQDELSCLFQSKHS